MTGPRYLHYTVSEENAGQTVEQLLRGPLGISLRKLRSVKYSEDGILLNGVRVRTSRIAAAGDILSVRAEDSEHRLHRLHPSAGPLEILFEDAALLFVNKPAGLVCHPGPAHPEDSLLSRVRAHLDEEGESAAVPHLLGRLDKDTSGIVGIAKDQMTAAKMHGEKTYYALVEGVPEAVSGCIRLPLLPKKNAAGFLKMHPCREDTPGALSACTRFEVLQVLTERGPVCSDTDACHDAAPEHFSLLRLQIGTGRMHQIRVHLAAAGYPLLGDPVYGHGASSLISRTALHAGEYCFRHPESGESFRLTAPLPADMAALIREAP